MVIRVLPLSVPSLTGAVGQSYDVAADRLIKGRPRQTVWPHFESADRSFLTGVWQGEPGAWRIEYTEQEYCEILGGVSVITDHLGQAVSVRAGDRFVIPAGFKGTWEVVETTRKVYVIHQAAPS